mmetsp:Transcript_99134/g.212413  ORF Transcript_99134/g.212413 Transcript_99134/m.212413 type:complete len:212 (+) Transcript_99134:76-711(+)
MLSCNRPLRKVASGPVGGAGAGFKPTQVVQKPGYLPAQQKRWQRHMEQDQHQKPRAANATTTSAAGDDKCTVASLLNPMLEDKGDPEDDLASHARQGSHSRAQVSRATSECSLTPKPRPAPLMDVVLGTLAKERVAVQRERHHQERRRSRRLSSAGSMASGASSCSSSCWSQAVRSTVLDLELDIERQRREEAEKELVALRAQLAEMDGGR